MFQKLQNASCVLSCAGTYYEAPIFIGPAHELHESSDRYLYAELKKGTYARLLSKGATSTRHRWLSMSSLVRFTPTPYGLKAL